MPDIFFLVPIIGLTAYGLFFDRKAKRRDKIACLVIAAIAVVWALTRPR